MYVSIIIIIIFSEVVTIHIYNKICGLLRVEIHLFISPSKDPSRIVKKYANFMPLYY